VKLREEAVANQPPTSALAVGRLQLVGYASGNFGKLLLWGTADLTLLFLLTDIMEIDPALAGWAIMLSLCVNAVLDPLIGALADRIRSPLGRSAPLILIGAPLCGLAFALLYTLPAYGIGSLLAVGGLLVGFRAAYAVMDAPHNAVLATLSRQAGDRSKIASLRLLFSTFAGIVVIMIVPALSAARGGTGVHDLALIAASFGLLSTVAMIVAALAVCHADRPAPGWHLAPLTVRSRAAALLSRPVVLILAITLVLNTGLPLFAKMILYHATYVIDDPPRANTMFIAILAGTFAGLPLWIIVQRKLSPVGTMGLAVVTVVVAAIFMAVFGGRTPTGDIVLAFGFGLAACGIHTVIWVMVAECADAFERDSGVAAPGLIFALVIVAIKLGQGLGAMATGQMLSLAGFVPHLSTGAEVGPTITALQAGGPVVAATLAGVLLWAYRSALRDAKHPALLMERHRRISR
jgi:glycoside/pentoside/hexuronide:cation symporter, GPH family